MATKRSTPAKKTTTKTTTRKATAKKTATQTTAKKPTTRKPQASRPAAKKTTASKKPAQLSILSKQTLELKAMLKRPDAGETMPMNVIRMLVQDLTSLKEFIEIFAAHMRALDRKRLNGVGIKRQGFAERAFMLAKDNPEFLPHWLSIPKFQNDSEKFVGLRNAYDIYKQGSELLWNLVMVAADVFYTDGLEFYYPVKEAAHRRVDAAETPYKELAEFFEALGKKSGDQPTEKTVKRNVNALLKGKKSGKVSVESVMPKKTKGSRKIVDETFKDEVQIKEIED